MISVKLAEKAKTIPGKIKELKGLLQQIGKSKENMFDYSAIELKRKLSIGYAIGIEPIEVDDGPEPGYDDDITFGNEVYSGVDVAQKFKDAKYRKFIDRKFEHRLLQIVRNDTIYNYTKTLLSKTILGKTFSAKVEVKCYLIILQFDHQVQCRGKVLLNWFSKSKTITIFSFKKSVSFQWSWHKVYSGSWNFNVNIGLPSPVSALGLRFRFNTNYAITLDLGTNTNIVGSDQYRFKARAVAVSQVNTNAQASVRVLALEGGVFINGILVKVTTDPTLTLSYYFTAQKIIILAQWYF